jgi:23S rRNA (guanosine2251-2'-O)-methyltransferase
VEEFEIIYGMHSIAEALKNSKRTGLILFCTDDSYYELRKLHFGANAIPTDTDLEVVTLAPHALQEEAKRYIKELEYKDSRVPSNIFLKADLNPFIEMTSFYEDVEQVGDLKILALDQVTDVHNLAAIIRTAAFYAIDYVVFSKKGQNHFPPSFYRIASGGVEHVKLVNCSSLSKFLHKLSEKGVTCVGLSEHATSETFPEQSKICFVMGSEDTGLSHASQRVLSHFVSLEPFGKIRSLNVSVAAAVAIEKFWVK